MPRRAKPPTPFEAVLANVRPGHVAYLDLNRAQQRALRDRDGRIFLDVLRHMYAAIQTAKLGYDDFTAVEEAVQAVAAKIGHQIGDKRCREFGRRLVAAGVIEAHGSYRQPYKHAAGDGAHRVPLYRLTSKLRTTRTRLTRRTPQRRPYRSAFVGNASCWDHPLFGGGGRKRVRSYSKRLQKWREPPEWQLVGCRIYEVGGAT